MATNAKCMFCEKTFFDNSSRNRHQKKFHNQEQRGQQSTSFRAHIFCSLCPKDEKESFASYALLTRHLAARHDIEVKETSIEFPNTADFENWMTSERLNTKFVLQRTARYRNIYTKYYCCNRSNSAGYKSQGTKHATKTGGTIKINGVCPSRIVAKVSEDRVSVVFVVTHVGHNRELRAEHLSNREPEEIARKLQSGVSTNRILMDARVVKCNQLERISLLNKDDLKHIKKKFNIEKRRNSD